MRPRARHVVSAIVTTILITLTPAWSQVGPAALRIKGHVRTESGEALTGARVLPEATAGVLGGQFAGQRTLKATTNKKGEWAIIGMQRGIWLFRGSAADHLPHAFVLSIYAMQATQLSMVPWELTIALRPRGALPKDAAGAEQVLSAADHAVAGRRTEAFTLLSGLGRPDLSPEIQCAAGDVALYLNESGIARALFDRVVSSKPDWYRGYLGLASAALLQNDFDPAAKAYWKARDLAPGELKQALSATVGELQKITGYR